MTEQEQKTFNQMRDALESSAVCIQLMSDGPSRASWGDTLDIIDAALTAANAVSEQQGEAARLKAFLHKHKSSALPEGACVTCEGEGEIGGQFCGGFQECSDCAGTGKKSAHPQDTEPAWRPIESAPKLTQMLIFYRNLLGNGRTVKARFVPRFSEGCCDFDESEHVSEYDEKGDRFTLIEGWYEQIDNWGEFSEVYISGVKPTHWMPLPAPPEAHHGK